MEVHEGRRKREKEEKEEKDTGGVEPKAGWYSLKGCALYVSVNINVCI